MRALRFAWMTALAPLLCAQAININDLIATQRKQIEAADFRATGHLVSIDAAGVRLSFPITIKARWLPGVLHVWVEIGQPPSVHRDMREHILLEMRPNGENTIRVADPGDTTARIVPFDSWSLHPLGPGFNYEDFLEQQYFWPRQASEGQAKFGARNCDVIRSTPGESNKTHYAEVKTWIDPSIGFPVYVEKTEKESGAVKEFTSFDLRHVGGIWSATQIEEKTHGMMGSTLLIINRGSPKANLSARDFTPESIARF